MILMIIVITKIMIIMIIIIITIITVTGSSMFTEKNFSFQNADTIEKHFLFCRPTDGIFYVVLPADQQIKLVSF